MLLAGRGGMIGSVILQRLTAEPNTGVDALSISWTLETSLVIDQIVNQAMSFLASVGAENWTIIWAAGRARVGASQVETAQEAQFFRSLLTAVENAQQLNPRLSKGRVVLLSSVGALQVMRADGAVSPRDDYYAQLKQNQETELLRFCERSGHSGHSLRLTNAYGPLPPHSEPRGAIQSLCHAVLSGTTFRILGSADVRRNYMHIDDIAQAVAQVLHEMLTCEPLFSVRLIFGPSDHSVGELIEVVRRVSGRSVIVHHVVDSGLNGLHAGDMHIGPFLVAQEQNLVDIESGIESVLTSLSA